MRAIFISYRRDDAEGEAGRLFDDLAGEFGAEKVFMDVAGIEPGRDFRKVIDQNVASCGVLLAIIGKGWIDARDGAGRRRLDDPVDFVRLETASALKRDIPVIPVLVRGAQMPRAEQLPEDLRDLAYRNAVELTHARWGSDVQLLLKALRPLVGGVEPGGDAVKTQPASSATSADGAASAAGPARSSRRWWVAAAIAAVVAAAGGLVAYEYRRMDQTAARQAADQAAARQAVEEAAARQAAEEAAAREAAARQRAAARDAAAKEAAAKDAAAKEAAARDAAAKEAAAQEAAAREAAAKEAAAKDAAAREAAAREAAAARGTVNSVDRIAFDPPTRSTLSNGRQVKVSFSYATSQEEGVRIFVRPLAGGSAAPQYAASASRLFPTGRGTGSATFTIRSGNVTIDEVQIQMKSAAENQVLFTTVIPVNYEFGRTPSESSTSSGGSGARPVVKILDASCRRTGADLYAVQIRGEASGPDSAVLSATASPSRPGSATRFALRCARWTSLPGANPRCQRQASQPSTTSFQKMDTVFVPGRSPNTAIASLYTDDFGPDARPRPLAVDRFPFACQ